MKKILFTFAIMACASLVFASTPWEKKLPFKNATITYEAKGTFKGTKILYIKDYGKTRAEYSDTEMKILGIAKADKEFTITTPDWIYTYTDGDDNIMKQTNPDKFLTEEYNKLSSSDKKKFLRNMESTGVSTVKSFGGEVEKAAAKVMGYTCDKVTMMGITAYTITGTDITLKSVGSVMGMKENTEAVSINKKSPPASVFKLPKGIEISYSAEADAMAREQIKSSVQSILTGDGKSMVNGQPKQKEGGSHMLTDEQKEKMKGLMNVFGGN